MTGVFRMLLVAVAALSSEQQLGRARCRLTLDSAAVPLSGELRVTLTIDGPGPVEVEVPRPVTASGDWQARALPPKTNSLENGRERWEQTFLLKPFQTGDVPLKLEPVRYRTGNEVRDWQLIWPAQNIHVTSSVSSADLGSARPVTDIEPLPTVEPRSGHGWILAVGTIILIIALEWILLILLRKRVTPQPVLSARERALAELAQIEPTPQQLARLADVLRQFLEEQYQLAATRQTTGEFAATLRAANVVSEVQIESVSEILARCDLVKFAGVQPDLATCMSLLQRARMLIEAANPTGQALPSGSAQSTR
jgi:hypothetical protein